MHLILLILLLILSPSLAAESIVHLVSFLEDFSPGKSYQASVPYMPPAEIGFFDSKRLTKEACYRNVKKNQTFSLEKPSVSLFNSQKSKIGHFFNSISSPPVFPNFLVFTNNNILFSVHSDSGFFGIALPVPPSIEWQMHTTGSWKQDCPVSIGELSYLVLVYWGFDGNSHIGELIVHQKLAKVFLDIFQSLYEVKFPIEKMSLIENYQGNDLKSIQDNNTSAFNCRNKTGQSSGFSQHSYGTAIDINPLQNPYVTAKTSCLKYIGWEGEGQEWEFMQKLGYMENSTNQFCLENPTFCIILPPQGLYFIDRTKPLKAMIRKEDFIVHLFKEKGFTWGGEWKNILDYQHFQYDLDD